MTVARWVRTIAKRRGYAGLVRVTNELYRGPLPLPLHPLEKYAEREGAGLHPPPDNDSFSGGAMKIILCRAFPQGALPLWKSSVWRGRRSLAVAVKLPSRAVVANIAHASKSGSCI